MLSDLDQPVETFAVNQRLEVGAHQNIGRRFAGFGIPFHTDWRVCPGADLVAYICGKCQNLIAALARRLEIDRDKGRVIHRDPDLFNRRDKKIIVAFLLQDR